MASPHHRVPKEQDSRNPRGLADAAGPINSTTTLNNAPDSPHSLASGDGIDPPSLRGPILHTHDLLGPAAAGATAPSVTHQSATFRPLSCELGANAPLPPALQRHQGYTSFDASCFSVASTPARRDGEHGEANDVERDVDAHGGLGPVAEAVGLRTFRCMTTSERGLPSLAAGSATACPGAGPSQSGRTMLPAAPGLKPSSGSLSSFGDSLLPPAAGQLPT